MHNFCGLKTRYLIGCVAAIHKNLEVRFDSTSGGMFSALAEKMYKEGVSLKSIGAYYEKERAKIDGILKLRYQRISKMK